MIEKCDDIMKNCVGLCTNSDDLCSYTKYLYSLAQQLAVQVAQGQEKALENSKRVHHVEQVEIVFHFGEH